MGKKIKNISLLFAVLFFIACITEPIEGIDAGEDAGTDTNTNTDTNTGTDTNTDTVTYANTDSGTKTDECIIPEAYETGNWVSCGDVVCCMVWNRKNCRATCFTDYCEGNEWIFEADIEFYKKSCPPDK
ncbi:MAG: hypothetical protein WC430_03940 [Patescibacteria group bacterium]